VRASGRVTVKVVYMLYVIMPEKGADAEALKFYEATAMKFLDSFKPENLGGRPTSTGGSN